ncbi:DUF3142 domain-containing protein [Methylovirgula sp. 4M-Z18]|uniref:DUF3142 domain-containing protein n=1 Tax=Methylovirgula sp. 4M-Z18 TaxID=2293567 RepID=UPI001FDF5D35|nr:DUF3142 domain-containing protein [Methylovirgula sp. 4M-Z18]
MRATDSDSYWLWAGVRARPEVQQAKTVYLLQGEIGADRSGQVRMKAQGGGMPAAHTQDLWLSYRVRSLDWPPEMVAALRNKLDQWRAQPGSVKGIQVDFDAATRNLKNYAAFLRNLRAALPPDCKLSVTGLMDWASQATPEDLDALAGTVDEVIFQTYRGRRTVPDIDAYVARLGRLHIPFRLGLAEGADWSAPATLVQNPHFQGYVIFLRNVP